MMTRWAQAGAVNWIGLRPSRRVEMLAVEAVEVTEAGLHGDRARAGKRAVTLIQAEHLPAIGAYLGREPVPAHLLRRNRRSCVSSECHMRAVQPNGGDLWPGWILCRPWPWWLVRRGDHCWYRPIGRSGAPA